MEEGKEFYVSLKENLIREKNPDFAKELGKRLFDFLVKTVRFFFTISGKYEYFVF